MFAFDQARHLQDAPPLRHIPAAVFQDPFLQAHNDKVENALTRPERTQIENWLTKIILTPQGHPRPHNEAMKEVFLLNDNRALASLEASLQKRLGTRLRDYLAERVDFFYFGDPSIPPTNKHGAEPISPPTNPSDIIDAATPPANDVTASRSESHSRSRHAHETKHDTISAMNLEALLSKEEIGSLEPPGYGQATYGFALPTAEGYTRFTPRSTEPSRTLPALDPSLPVNLTIKLPVTRLRDGVLPVPPGYQVVGAYDQQLELLDPHADDPFCTRSLNHPEASTLTYALRKHNEPVKPNQELFKPSPEEQKDWQTALPLTEEEERVGKTSLFDAQGVVMKRMTANFLYACDDRLGQLIQKYPQRLAEIVDGLRVGHCDVLAWTAAAYFRQLGYSAVVVHTEITNNEGTAFMRDMTHSRVTVIDDDGGMLLLDPTELCRHVAGYGLQHITDSELKDLEHTLDAEPESSNRTEALQNFRALIEERERLALPESPTIPAHVRRLETSNNQRLPGIDITNEEIDDTLGDLYRFRPLDITPQKRRAFNALLNLLNARKLGWIDDPILQLKCIQSIESLTPEQRQLWGRHIKPEEVSVLWYELLLRGKTMRTVYPEMFKAWYQFPEDQLESLVSHAVKTRDPAFAGSLNKYGICYGVSALPNPSWCPVFSHDFDPKGILDYSYDISVIEHLKRARFLGWMALAMSNPGIQEQLEILFGDLDDDFFRACAYMIEPALTPRALPRRIAKNLFEFSGKNTHDDYRLFIERARLLHQEITVRPEELSQACRQVYGLLMKMPLTGQRTRTHTHADSDLFDQKAEPYDPARGHTPDLIDPNLSAKYGTWMIKEPAAHVKSPPTIHIHTDFSAAECGNAEIIAGYARTLAILKGARMYTKKTGIKVLTSAEDNDYLEITPRTSDQELPVIVFRLIYRRADRANSNKGIYGFHTHKGLPRHLLYLSSNEGRANAVKYVLGKQTHLTAKTFQECGLDIFPILREAPEEP